MACRGIFGPPPAEPSPTQLRVDAEVLTGDGRRILLCRGLSGEATEDRSGPLIGLPDAG
jgi:hypothetical protein